ncbi:hypothetical protein lerEdw1_005828 [Lerista edwardsae]|nr:hypothetical protein lerEdw1_005828 [Lerista edwardsae]
MGDSADVNSNLIIAYSTGDSQLDKAIWQWLTWDKVGKDSDDYKADPVLKLVPSAVQQTNFLLGNGISGRDGLLQREGLLSQDVRPGSDPDLMSCLAHELWSKKNPKTKEQIESLLRNGRNKELRDRLCRRLTFGTAGLRSAMGAGFCYINDLTVIQSTQGMYKYLEKCFSDFKQRGFVVGYDTRGQVASSCSSLRLAKLTAAVLLAKGIKVYLFSRYVPTPFVPYAVQQLRAVAGVMITASHNRKEDNGYKVYWENGAQITSPHDKEILKCIEECTEPWNDSWNENLADTSLLAHDPLQKICASYMEDLRKISYHRELNMKTNLKFVHTAFHGVGHDYVQLAFQTFGFQPPIPVPEQKDPDPDFSTVKCPNPEEGESVLELSLRLAEKEGARVVVATDPDADRLAVAELQENGRWKVFTGNELAALFGWWMFTCWKSNCAKDADVKNVYMLATTVSSKILKAIAQKEGFHFEDTLPGFKSIGSRVKDLLDSGKEVLFAFEESIGFMCGTSVLDKDGVSAAVVIAEMAAYLDTKSQTLAHQLMEVYKTIYMPKVEIFATLSLQVLPVSKNSQMITFTFQNGCVATLRTSGTEPKIKYYAEMCAPP